MTRFGARRRRSSRSMGLSSSSSVPKGASCVVGGKVVDAPRGTQKIAAQLRVDVFILGSKRMQEGGDGVDLEVGQDLTAEIDLYAFRWATFSMSRIWPAVAPPCVLQSRYKGDHQGDAAGCRGLASWAIILPTSFLQG